MKSNFADLEGRLSSWSGQVVHLGRLPDRGVQIDGVKLAAVATTNVNSEAETVEAGLAAEWATLALGNDDGARGLNDGEMIVETTYVLVGSIRGYASSDSRTGSDQDVFGEMGGLDHAALAAAVVLMFSRSRKSISLRAGPVGSVLSFSQLETVPWSTPMTSANADWVMPSALRSDLISSAVLMVRLWKSHNLMSMSFS